MGIKINNLQRLLNDNINVHDFCEVKTLEELIRYSETNKSFSIRFDRNYQEHNLPFYVYDESIKDKDTYFKNIIEEMHKLDCTLLCSNGHAYDNILKFNFVIDIDEKANFILELCDQKIPLRLMYQYKTTIIKGNLFQDKYEIINKEANTYDEEDISKIINYVVVRKYKYLEGTLYQSKVGKLNDDIVIWQTD